MTQLDIFKATMNHEPHGKFLYYAHFTPSLFEQIFERTGTKDWPAIVDYFGMFIPISVGLYPPAGLVKADYSHYFADMDVPSNAFINDIGVLEIPGSSYHFTRYISPLRNATTLEEVEKYTYPGADGYTGDHMANEVADAHAKGLVTSCWVGHMYEHAWQIRGYEEFLMDLLAAPEICEHLLDTVCRKNIITATAAAKAGVDFIQTGDDVANQRAMMFDPDIWRKFMKPRWKSVYDVARSINPDIQIWYHSDGDIEPIIPDLIEIGITILNPVQPECVDPIKLKKEYGKHLVFDGAIGTQTTMPFATPDEVRQVVTNLKETLGKDGALILSPTHILEPEVPVENILAFFEAAGD